MTTDFVALTAETFAPHVGRTFQIRGGRHALALNEIERAQADGDRAPFTLLFSGPPGDVLAEGLHAIELEDGTAYDLYLIPIHTTASGRQDYQAVFN
uniref:DUF6916 domain-containing protein n=1 Tax=Caulobacter sp. (strain K31) TaxID=366602 RepID=B0SX65_CAUSK